MSRKYLRLSSRAKAVQQRREVRALSLTLSHSLRLFPSGLHPSPSLCHALSVSLSTLAAAQAPRPCRSGARNIRAASLCLTLSVTLYSVSIPLPHSLRLSLPWPQSMRQGRAGAARDACACARALRPRAAISLSVSLSLCLPVPPSLALTLSHTLRLSRFVLQSAAQIQTLIL